MRDLDMMARNTTLKSISGGVKSHQENQVSDISRMDLLLILLDWVCFQKRNKICF